MMSFRCENPSCSAAGTIVCAKCREQGFSKRIDSFCSKECQKLCFESHQPFHSCIRDCKDNDTNVSWTCALALKELYQVNRLPELSTNGELSLYFFGCEDGFENSHIERFDHLFQVLKVTLYPSLSKLKIVLNGIGLSPSSSIMTNSSYIETLVGPAEAIIPSLGAEHSLAVLLQPGLSVNLESWDPAFRLLVDNNFPCLVTGYSYCGLRMTTDSVFDQRIVSSYFMANVVVPMTSNPASYYCGQFRKMAYYFCFQGRITDPTVQSVSRVQLQRDNQRAFVIDLIYVTAKFDRRPAVSKRCEHVLHLIDSGDSPFSPMATMAEVDNYLTYEE